MVGDSYEPGRRRSAERRLSVGRAALILVVLTVLAALTAVVAADRLSADRAQVAAFRAAPTCPSGKSATVAAGTDCKQVAAYTVTYAYQQGSGRDWKAFIGVRPASGVTLALQFSSPGNQLGFADVGDTVHLTLWHGVPIYVANAVLNAELVNPLLESGDGPYLWIWYTGAVYLFLVLLILIRRRVRLLLLAPAIVLAVGLALHDSVVGGDWRHCVLYLGIGVIVLYYILYPIWRSRPIRALLHR
jgi:hypothetical protein